MIQTTNACGLNSGSTRRELGTQRIHHELERTTAKFIGREDAIAVGMGFATNTLHLPQLLSRGTLVLSDEKNHASIVLGVRLSGATGWYNKISLLNNNHSLCCLSDVFQIFGVIQASVKHIIIHLVV